MGRGLAETSRLSNGNLERGTNETAAGFVVLIKAIMEMQRQMVVERGKIRLYKHAPSLPR